MKQPLNYEAMPSYSLTVTATDSDKETTSVPVTITVTDVGPSFGKASYSFTIDEDAESNAEVGTVTALLEGDFAGFDSVEYEFMPRSSEFSTTRTGPTP